MHALVVPKLLCKAQAKAHLGVGGRRAVLVLHSSIHQHLGHGNGTVGKVRVVVEPLPNLECQGGYRENDSNLMSTTRPRVETTNHVLSSWHGSKTLDLTIKNRSSSSRSLSPEVI